jgi:hypothetical protein
VTQLWSPDTNVTVFIHYHDEEKHMRHSACEYEDELSYEESFTKELVCYDGWTDVGVFVYFDEELSIEECVGCSPPDGDDDNVIAYYFEVRNLRYASYH